MRISQTHKRISKWKRIIQNRMANSNLRVFHVCGNDYHHHYYSWFGAGLKRSKFCESWDLSGAKFSQAKNFSNKKPFNVDLFHILPTMRISQSTSRLDYRLLSIGWSKWLFAFAVEKYLLSIICRDDFEVFEQFSISIWSIEVGCQ